MKIKCYYFGCHEQAGHYLYTTEGRHDWTALDNLPWTNIDGGLCPDNGEVQGEALLHHKDYWTALAFWDRSADSRFKSNSAFIAEGVHDFANMLSIARDRFPWKTFPFEIVPFQETT